MTAIWLARPEQPAPGTPVAVKDLLDTAGDMVAQLEGRTRPQKSRRAHATFAFICDGFGAARSVPFDST